MPVTTMQALDESITEDLQCGSQAKDSNGIEGMMNMLVDISSRLQATEERMQETRTERAATCMLSPSTTHADHGRACHQPSSQVLDLSEAEKKGHQETEAATHHHDDYNK